MDLRARYRRECLLADTAPLHVIESSLGDASLKFNFFRIPPPEWRPLLTSLESDTTLRKITVTIDYNEYTINNPTHLFKLKHLPAFITSLSYHLRNNANLNELSLNGLPLTDEMLDSLIQGFLLSKSLQHLNLSSSKLSNNQALKILSAVEKKPKLVWLELCCCGLTSRCKDGLFNLIHNQVVSRENAAWKASLRQESTSLELMGGLRRLSLSDNDLGDAIDQLALALAQDNCLKALDLQFCQLENSHLELLIDASTKNPALVFIDVTNNNSLDSTLVKELQNILKCKITKEADCPFTPLALFKRSDISSSATEKPTPVAILNKKPTTTPVNTRKMPVKKKIFAKPAKPIIPTKSPQREERAKIHVKQKSEDIEDSLKSIREELYRERELRLDAERQVIKIYAEMESAWIKMNKLEKEVKKLKKQKTTLMSGSYSNPVPFNNPTSLLVDQPTLKDFHVCLGQLRTMLQRLSWDPAITRNANASLNAKTNGIDGILKNLHSAVNDLALSVNIPEREKGTQLPNGSQSYGFPCFNENLAQNLRTAAAFQPTNREAYNSPTQMNNDQRLLPERIRKPADAERGTGIITAFQDNSPIQAIDLDQKTPKNVAERNFTSTPVSCISASMRNPQMTPSVLISKGIKATFESAGRRATNTPPHRNGSLSSLSQSLTDKKSNLVHFSVSSSVEEQKSETSVRGAPLAESVPKERISSLKNLQNNLEGLLQQFHQREVEPLEMSRYANSLLPVNDGVSVSEGENIRHEKYEYSMDFDSTTTSIRTISNELKKLSRNATPNFNDIPPVKKSTENSKKIKDKPINSHSSSTLNLSSIVDLLGDFSVGDIGSSTLTPP